MQGCARRQLLGLARLCRRFKRKAHHEIHDVPNLIRLQRCGKALHRRAGDAIVNPAIDVDRTASASVAGGAIIVAGLAVVPLATHMVATPVNEWIGASVGFGIGMTLRFQARRLVFP